MHVCTAFAEPFSEDASSYRNTTIVNDEGEKDSESEVKVKVTRDELASDNEGKLVYVWKGPMKGRIGRVLSMSGQYARVSITGTVGGNGVHEMRRVNLMK